MWLQNTQSAITGQNKASLKNSHVVFIKLTNKSLADQGDGKQIQ